MLELDNVNAVFRQAAVEDELDSVANSTVIMEPIVEEDSTDFSTHVEAQVTTNLMDPATLIPDTSPEEPHAGFYRWDSSPWTVDTPTPLPLEDAPREFPMRGEWDS